MKSFIISNGHQTKMLKLRKMR